VLFTGDGGGASQLGGNFGYADAYFKAGYEVVQLAWGDDWEYSYDPFGAGEAASIQDAACRSATFLYYAYNNIFSSVSSANSVAGYCAHAASAGSAEIAYSLAYYGAGNWLDNVELLAGPVFSDIKQGCEVPAPANVTICGGTQYGYQLGGGSSWQQSPSYTGVASQVGLWTNDTSCRGSANTSSTSNTAWLAQSIVDQSTGATPTFDYSASGLSGRSIGMSAWLCRTVAGNGQANNSSPQGEIFYANIGPSNSPPHYDVYAVDGCSGSEGVGGGAAPGFYANVLAGDQPAPTGSQEIVWDMIGYSNNNGRIPAQCFHGKHQ
jgi:hypothetical protein